MKTLQNNAGFLRYLKNTSWLMGDKVFRMLLALIVGVWVTRYLGPEDYGIFSYARSFVALFMAFSSLGLNDLLVRELVRSRDNSNTLLGTSFGLQSIGSTIIMIILIVSVYLNDNDALTNKIIIILGLVTYVQSFGILTSYFNSLVKSKFIAIASMVGIIISAVIKVILILIKAPLIYFVYTLAFEIILSSAGLIIAYYRLDQSIRNWKFSAILSKRLLRDSWPLVLSSIIISIYMKVDQVMIKEFMDSSAVGYYAAAVHLSEAWYFIPSIICNSLFPAIVNAKVKDESLYRSRMQSLYDLMVILGFSVVIPVTLFSSWGIKVLYGPEFSQTATVLNIHIWSGIFVFLGVANAKWYISENLQKIKFLGLSFGLFANVILNLLLIPKYGIQGAAYATLISQFVSAFLSPVVFKKTRPSFFMMLNSLLLISIFKELKSRLKQS